MRELLIGENEGGRRGRSRRQGVCRDLCLRTCAHTSVLLTSKPKNRGVQEGACMYMHACYLDPV